MTILIHDSPRNCVIAWGKLAYERGVADAVVLNPWASRWPHDSTPSFLVRERAAALSDEGITVWFDPMTHVLQMPGVGDFRYYAEYDLWSGTRGDLGGPADMVGHVKRVFRIQDSLSARHLAPTILLHAGLSADSDRALQLARAAVTEDADCWLSVSGTPSFWASVDLDAHIGALAQLQPQGWFLSVVRPHAILPTELERDDVFGLCRSSRALSEHAPVMIPYGDLAALPAVAAGAQGVGTGWDQQQRVCGYPTFVARDPDGDGLGGWYKRPTFEGLLGSLKDREAAELEARDQNRYLRLGPPAVVEAKEGFLHHAEVLGRIVTDLLNSNDYEARYRHLAELYRSASAEWPAVVSRTSSRLDASNWVDEPLEGLALYGRSEGW